MSWLRDFDGKKLLKKLNFLIGIAVIFVLAGCASYKADDYSIETLNLVSENGVNVEKHHRYIYFDSGKSDTLLIFYPGGAVDYLSYVPLMEKFSEAGIDCALLRVPFNFAILLGTKTARYPDRALSKKYKNIYLGGHSLGGVGAAYYAKRHMKKIQGLLFLASYPTKEFNNPDFKCIFVNGSNDQVLNREKWAEHSAPGKCQTFYKEIEGGNHAGFGNYGAQAGDGIATISPEEQQKQAVEFFINCIEK